jgi:hypothetical protein
VLIGIKRELYINKEDGNEKNKYPARGFKLKRMAFFFGITALMCSKLFADNGIEHYMGINNMKYPYNIGSNINDSRFIDYSIEGMGDSVDEHNLTYEQRNIVMPFFELLNLMSVPEYFIELKKQPDVIAFSIDHIHLVKYSLEKKYIHAYIRFYADQNPGGFARYNTEYNFWEYFNIAIFSIGEHDFLGFHFD